MLSVKSIFRSIVDNCQPKSLSSWVKKWEFKNNPFIFLLLAFVIFVSFANYKSGSILSGWDTLHPEFNFALYFKRTFFGVWQEHQGLGTVASQSHAGELPRLFIYYLSSLFLDSHFLRYGYFFLTWLVGSLGTYFFLQRKVFKDLQKINKNSLSFSGALAYLLNLTVLQQYYVPLEMFATHFATLPWLLLLSTNYLEKGRKKNLLLFSLVTLFSSSISHTPTLFYAYFLGLLLYLAAFSLSDIKKFFTRSIVLVLATVIINSFWLLPNFYFVLTSGHEVSESKIHTQFSDKAFLTGKKFGDIENIALLKNFLFDWGEYDEKNRQFVDLFDEWMPHLNNPITKSIGYSVFVFVGLGILATIKTGLKGKVGIKNYPLALLPIFAISIILIANNNPVSSALFSYLDKNIPITKEALRFPFTKFSILLTLTYAVYFAIGVNFFLNWVLKKRKNLKSLFWIQAYIVLLGLSFYMLPGVAGNFISPSMKVNIPQGYFDMFSWFEKQDDGRIAPFPVDSFWGWTYHKWGYEGAGFRWFGLKQPILDREFDRWSYHNENYYWEISYAVYSQNKDLFESVLDKYQIKRLLVDESILNPSSAKSVYLDELNKMIKSSARISIEKDFGQIKIYKFEQTNNIKDFVFINNNLPEIGPTYKWSNYDVGYLENGNYVTTNDIQHTTTNVIYYPFRSLFTNKTQADLEFEVEVLKDNIVFRKKLPEDTAGYYLNVPKVDDNELIWIDPKNLKKTKKLNYDVFYDSRVIEVKIPKAEGYYSAEIDSFNKVVQQNEFAGAARNCNPKAIGWIKDEKVIVQNKSYLRLESLGANNCSAAFWLGNLPNKYAYLISVQGRNRQGKSLLYWIENLNSRRVDAEEYLPKSNQFTTSYFIQPPMEADAVGYTLHFDNISIGSDLTVNDLGHISVIPIPFNFLSHISLRPQLAASRVVQMPSNVNFRVSHPNPSAYVVYVGDGVEVLTLSQGYSEGWQAYRGNFQFLAPILGERIKEHVLVNNWENGWTLDKSAQEIVIIFLPQYLEYFGLLILPVYFGLIWRLRKLP